MYVVPASTASLAESRAAWAVQASFSGRRSMSPESQPENVPPAGASSRLKPRWTCAFTAPGIIVKLGKNLTSASGFSRPTSVSAPTVSMRPSFTSKAPSCRGGDETGIRVPAAKITGQACLSGIPPDHLRGHGLQKLAFLAVRQEAYVFEGGVDLTPGPLLGPRVGEYAPDRRLVPFAQGEDDRQRHGALHEVRSYALAHKPRLADEVHDVVRHLEGYAQSLSVAGQSVDLYEREPAERSAGHARGLEKACGLLSYVLQVRLDIDRSPVRAVLLQLASRESDRGFREGADKPGVPDPRQLRESLGEEVVSRSRRDLTPVPRNSGRRATPALGPVHDVVVDQGGGVKNFYDGRGPEQILPLRLPHARAQYQK